MNALSQFLLLEIVLAVVTIAAVVRVWRASTLDGVLTLLVPFYFLVSLVKYWKDPDHHIRWHVLILIVGSVFLFYSQQRVLHAIAEQQAAEMRAQVASIRSDEDGDGDETPDTSAPSATIEFGPAARLAARAPVSAARAPAVGRDAAAPVPASAPEPAPDRASAAAPEPAPQRDAPVSDPAPRLTLRQALAAATFQRGRLERSSAGFALDLPPRLHALSGADARRLAASLGQAPDPREVAWVVDENVALDAAASWHVSVRWLDDGWVALPGTSPDAERLLRTAQRADATSRRLAGSGGVLIGYAVAPAFASGSVAWVEERLPDGAVASVLDCHALRFGEKGAIEFSVVGAAAGMQSRCNETVRSLALGATFGDGYDHETAPPPLAAARAPYSLPELVAHLK